MKGWNPTDIILQQSILFLTEEANLNWLAFVTKYGYNMETTNF